MAVKLKPISNELILDSLRYDNPWWQTNTIDEESDSFPRRLYFDLFFKLVDDTEIKRAVVLMGPRRVGKTVLLHHTIDRLLKEKKIRSNKISFIRIDNPLYTRMSLEELFSLSMKAVGNDDAKGWYLFFDEIQYLPGWEKHLKVMVDKYPNTKFVVSGSAAAALKLSSEESGAGRFTDFMLPPLTFHEYLYLKKHTALVVESSMFWKKQKHPCYGTNNISALNKHFIDYINFGGYPEVIFSEKIQSNMGRYVKDDIIDKVLLRDLPSLYGIQNVQELNSFFTTLVYYTGNELSIDSLSKSSGVNKPTLNKYLDYLEAAFLIKVINRMNDTGKVFRRRVFFKIYLTNPSLRSALFSPLSATDEAMGHMVETAIFSQFLHRENLIPLYARWNKGEIDMVEVNAKTQKPSWAGEIKWSNKPYNYPVETKELFSFCQKNNLTDAIVTTIDKTDYKVIQEIAINYIPSALYALNAGFKTIGLKHSQLDGSKT